MCLVSWERYQVRKGCAMVRKVYLFILPILVLVGGIILSQSGSQNPHGQLKWDCQDCHTADSWSKIADTPKFDHRETGFSLVGAHATVKCIGCHKELTFAHVATECSDCHTDHHMGQLGTQCQTCHTPRDWKNRRDMLSIHLQRGFPLIGAHATAECEMCHTGASQQQFAGTSTNCFDCHSAEFSAATDPNHAQNNFDRDCTKCHSSGTWRPAKFDHASTGFMLTGRHSGVSCIACHKTGYAGTSSTCDACHDADFLQSTNPKHTLANFDKQCEVCHTTNGWAPAKFDHASTGYALTGRHVSALCSQCHATAFAGTATDCYTCHRTNFEQTTVPNHVTQGIQHDCTQCHSTNGWTPSTFNHAATAFPLTGRHQTATCIACHPTTYAGTTTDCYTCHRTDFEQTTTPNHVTQGIQHDCTQCHSTNGWTPSTFNHATTVFPLTGRHQTVTCLSCHPTSYAGTATDCYSCHRPAFELTTNPNHVQLGFSHDCLTCHSTNGWIPSTFNHSTTAFPLTGSHTTTPCLSCHANGYTGTPTTCVSCHLTKYNATTDPNHIGAGFSTDCKACHSTTAWTPSTWNHDTQNFPIYSGPHAGQWSTCATCHTNTSSYADFTCFTCHKHDKLETDNAHQQVNGYAYTSSACYDCHPRGRP